MGHQININLSFLPLFERDIFKKNPALFFPYLLNTPEYLKNKYRQKEKELLKYEETVQWPLINGPGFSGATHPGAGKTFNNLMIDSSGAIYNSDCLYIHPSRHIFAISDAPGISTASRRLFEKIDHFLHIRHITDIGTLVNNVNKWIRLTDRATLTMISLVKNLSGDKYDKAFALIAGDTYLYYGNIHQGKMARIEGSPFFLGRSSRFLDPIAFDLMKGDFFVIASDGITSMKPVNKETKLEDVLWDQLKKNGRKFVFKAIQQCNRIIEESTSQGFNARFCGHDDITLLVIYPEALLDFDSQESLLLGGCADGVKV